MATEHTTLLPELFHADRGSQYACESFRVELGKLHAQLSMSRKGNCWDNAVAESFFSTFNREVAVSFLDLEDARREIYDYFCFYNQERGTLRLDKHVHGLMKKCLTQTTEKWHN